MKDLRSYHLSNFSKIISLVEKRNKLQVDYEIYEQYKDLVNRIKNVEEEVAVKQKLMDDCPDDFIDQLFQIMMEIPVILPSGNKIDLNMLTKHLLNDPTDPYTRQPMQLEDAKIDTELK